MSSRSQARRDTLLDRVRRHVGPEVTLDRARSRTSAYIYGNILVLAVIAEVDPASILHWSALILVVVTTITTFLAHIVAHAIGQQLGRPAEEARLHLRDELRDSLPIANAGGIPAVMMLLGALSILPPIWAQLVAGVIVVARLAFMGVLVERITGRKSTLGMLWSGVLLALLSAAIVALKIVFKH